MYHLQLIQGLSIFQPAVWGFGFRVGFAFPHQSVINGLLNILRLLSQLRRSCEDKNTVNEHVNSSEMFEKYLKAAVL